MDPLLVFKYAADPTKSLFTKLKIFLNQYYGEGGKFSTSGDLEPFCLYLDTFDDFALRKVAHLIRETIEGFGETTDFFVKMRILGVEYEDIRIHMTMSE